MATEKVLIFCVLLSILKEMVYNIRYMIFVTQNDRLQTQQESGLASLHEGGGTPTGVTEGVSRNRTDTPPVKNQRFLPAPSQRGPRGRSPPWAAPLNDHLHKETL